MDFVCRFYAGSELKSTVQCHVYGRNNFRGAAQMAAGLLFEKRGVDNVAAFAVIDTVEASEHFFYAEKA